jgi:predicted DsbA family dithiol-disulfide isomerase
VRIEVFSDVVCPWCFLGARRLRAVLDSLATTPEAEGGGAWAAEVDVRWRAFQLDPTAGPGPGDLRGALERKYGPGAFDGMVRRFAALGPAEGISYDFAVARRVNTRDAHRLLAWAWDRGGAPVQNRLAEALFSSYFEGGGDVSDHDHLAALAEAVGLGGGAASEVLASGAFDDEVAADLRSASAADIHAVPTMVVAERLVIPGAQERDTLRALLVRAHQRFASD